MVRSVTVIHATFRFSSPPAADTFRRTLWTFPVPHTSFLTEHDRSECQEENLHYEKPETLGEGKTIAGYAKQCGGECHFKPRRSTYGWKNRCPSELGGGGGSSTLEHSHSTKFTRPLREFFEALVSLPICTRYIRSLRNM